MKGSSFAMGIVAGTALGAAISLTAENHLSPRMRRDIKSCTRKGRKAVEHLAENIGTLMHE